MKKQPIEILREGRRFLDSVLSQRGFSFQQILSGSSSGGDYANGAYINGNRRLEIHYRFSLGLVTYHFDKVTLDHPSYMRALLGEEGGNKYPGFSDDPLVEFENLAYDLEHFAKAFLEGNFDEFAGFVRAAEQWKTIPGFARLP